MLSYPVRLIPTDGKRVCAIVLDVPEAVSDGATEEEAMADIQKALEAALGRRRDRREALPMPSDVCGAPVVTTDKFAVEHCRPAPISGGR